MQIQINWLPQKPTDLDLHCLQRQGISGLSRTRATYSAETAGMSSILGHTSWFLSDPHINFQKSWNGLNAPGETYQRFLQGVGIRNTWKLGGTCIRLSYIMVRMHVWCNNARVWVSALSHVHAQNHGITDLSHLHAMHVDHLHREIFHAYLFVHVSHGVLHSVRQ